MITCLFSAIDDGWGPAIINNQQEHDFIKKLQKTFSNSVPYWIGGSSSVAGNIQYPQSYTVDDIGILLSDHL